MIKFLKTIFLKCLRSYYSMQYHYYSEKLKYLIFIRFSDFIEYYENIDYISEKHAYYKKKVIWCSEKLRMYATFP